ncbi:CRISPR-associated DxTHG motif protein [Calothrix sp. 336/3]
MILTITHGIRFMISRIN